VCTSYRGGEDAEFDHFPYHQSVLHRVRGEYEELDGFDADIGEVRTEEDLPDTAREYLQFIADQIGVPVALVGVGPGRDQVIWTAAAQSAFAPPLQQA
jgi:adenylosuccinate synthase